VIGNVWNLTLGGRDFDSVLYDYFNNEFKAKYKIDANTNVRARFRLLDEIEKVKKQMSANSNQLPLSIECLMNDKDVTHTIKRFVNYEVSNCMYNKIIMYYYTFQYSLVFRSDFEDMSKVLWDKLTNLLQKLLTETSLLDKIIATKFHYLYIYTCFRNESLGRRFDRNGGRQFAGAHGSPDYPERFRQRAVHHAQPGRGCFPWLCFAGVKFAINTVCFSKF